MPLTGFEPQTSVVESKKMRQLRCPKFEEEF